MLQLESLARILMQERLREADRRRMIAKARLFASPAPAGGIALAVSVRRLLLSLSTSLRQRFGRPTSLCAPLPSSEKKD